MRVLLVTHEKGLRGGERQLQFLAAGLQGRGHALALAAPADSALSQAWDGMAFKISMANELDLRAALGLRRAAAVFKPDLIHAFTSRAHGLVGLAHLPQPLVVTRAVSFPAGTGALGRRKYQGGVAAFIAVSTAVREALLRAGADPGRVEVIAPGVPPRAPDAGAGAELRRRHVPPGSWALGAVGALEPAKGFDLLLRALARLEAGCVLLVLGAGPEEARLRALAAELGVAGRFHLLPPGTSVEALLAVAQVAVSPSVSEGFGMAVVEAMSAGVPVVATDSGGVRDILSPGKNGILLHGRDPEDLARALGEVQRDAQAGRLGERIEAGRKTARGFGVERMVELSEALYLRTIGPCRPP